MQMYGSGHAQAVALFVIAETLTDIRDLLQHR